MTGHKIQYMLVLSLAGVCLVLAILSVAFDHHNRVLQGRLQTQVAAVQAEMQKVSGVKGISRDILTDMGNAAVSNVEIRVLLASYGYSLSNTNPAPKLSAEELSQGLARILAPLEADSNKAVQEDQP